MSANGFFRRALMLAAALILPLAMGMQQAGAAQSAPITRTAPAVTTASAAAGATRPVTLAQRRAEVRRELATPHGSPAPARRPATHGRPTVVGVRAAAAQGQARLTQHRARSGHASRLPAAGGAASAAPRGPAAQAQAAVTGVASSLWVAGPGGTVSAWSDNIAGYPSGDPGQQSNGLVFPGETLTATAEIFNSYNDCTGRPDGSESCPNVNYNVQVAWDVQCNGVDDTFNMNQVVSAPDEFTWVPTNGDLQGVLVPFTFQVSAQQCGPAGPSSPYLQNFYVGVTTSVVGVANSSGYVDVNNWESSMPVSQLQGCVCGPDSSGEAAADNFRGDAVNTATGEYSDSFTDASLKGPGYPLAVTRNYSSGVTASGPLGPGWTMPWFASLSVDAATGNVTFNSENGSQYLYTSNGDGTFQTPFGARSVLKQLSPGGYTLTTPQQNVLTFSSSGQVVSENDPTSRGLTFSYSGGQLTSVADAAGQSVSLTYSGGLLTQIALPDGQGVTYGYTGGELTSATVPGGASGATTTYSYNSAGLLASVEDANGNYVVRIGYGSSGQVTSAEDATGAVTSFSYTVNGGLNETDTTDPSGGKWSDIYGGNVLVETVDPLGKTTYYNYDYFLDVIEVIDPLGHSTTMTYDSNGNRLSETDPLGHQQQWTYDSSNNVLTYTDGNGNTATYTYNSMAEVTSVTSAAGGKATYSYDASGNLVSSTDPRGNVSGANAASYTATYAYSPSGQLVSATDADGNKTSFTYDSMGYPHTVTAPQGNVTTYGYDSAERLTTVTAPGGGVTTYGYDLAGNLISRADPDGHTWTYGYDPANRVIKATDPLGNSATYGYDGDGNQTTSADARGITTTTAYDASNRPLKITYSDGTPTVSYAYDANGDVTSVTDATGTRTLSYDADGQLTSAAGPGSGSFSYGYDAAGNVTSRTYPDGTKITYAYGPGEQPASMVASSATTAYSYDAAGNLTSTALPDGVTETRTYDGAGRLTKIADAKGTSTLDSYTLTLTADGPPSKVAITQHSTAQPTQYYTYDSAGRLISACATTSTCSTASGGGETAWTYDQAGNRLTQVAGGATTTYTYNAADELTKSVTGTATTTYAYDAAGDQTTAGPNSYTWNAANEMSKAVTSSGTFTYTYDSGGDLAAASKSGALQQTAVWDINNPLPLAVEQTGSSGSATADYVYAPDAALASEKTSAGTYYATTDWLRSVTGLINSSGSQATSTSYAAYGPASASVLISGSPTPSIGYAGSYSPPGGTGLDDMRARDYNPSTGAFTTVDPMLAVTGQPYAYASNVPTYYTDPSGRIVGIDNLVAGVIGAIVGGGGALLNDLIYGKKINWSDVAISAGAGFAYGAAADECGSICAGAASSFFGSLLTQIHDTGNANVSQLLLETAQGAAAGSFDAYMGAGGGQHVADGLGEAVKAGIWTAPQDLGTGGIDPASAYLNPLGALCSLVDRAGGGSTGVGVFVPTGP
jgi:RHS repeat-associated protein